MTELKINDATSVYITQGEKDGVFLILASAIMGRVRTYLTVQQVKQLIRDLEFNLKR